MNSGTYAWEITSWALMTSVVRSCARPLTKYAQKQKCVFFRITWAPQQFYVHSFCIHFHSQNNYRYFARIHAKNSQSAKLVLELQWKALCVVMRSYFSEFCIFLVTNLFCFVILFFETKIVQCHVLSVLQKKWWKIILSLFCTVFFIVCNRFLMKISQRRVKSMRHATFVLLVHGSGHTHLEYPLWLEIST